MRDLFSRYLQSPRCLFWSSLFCAIIFVTTNSYYRPVISSDATLYFLTANVFIQKGLSAAMHTYPWPFYSILLASLHTLLGMSLVLVAHLLNYLFFLAATIAFLCCLREFSRDIRYHWLGLFLFFGFYYFTRLYFDAIRDTAYFAFYLFALFACLRFSKTLSWVSAALWSISTMIAFLFRIEGGFFLIIIPFVVFAFSGLRFRSKLFAYLKLNAVLLVLLLCLICLTLIFGQHFLSHVHASRFSFFSNNLLHVVSVVFSHFDSSAKALTPKVLSNLFAPYRHQFLLFGYIGLYFYIFLKLLGFGLIVCLLFSLKHVIQSFKNRAVRVALAYVLINLCVTFLFMLVERFVTARYMVAMVLTLLCFLPAGLMYCYQACYRDALTWWRKAFFILVLLSLLLSFFANLIHFGPSKRYIIQTATWLNAHVKPGQLVFSPNRKLPFYVKVKHVGRYCDVQGYPNPKNPFVCFMPNYIEPALWWGADYAVFDVKNKKMQAAIMKAVGHSPIKVFKSNRYRHMLVFKLN